MQVAPLFARASVTVISALLGLPAVRVCFGSPHAESFARRVNGATPIVVAHRGCSEQKPENSSAALRECIRKGVDVAETDVRSTRDGVLVLLHDETLERTTTLMGPLRNLSYSEVKRARLRFPAGSSSVTPEHVPRLDDFLETARGRILLLLHLKEPLYDRVYDAVVAKRAQSGVAFLIEQSARDPQLLKAQFTGRVAYVPVVWQCEPGGTSACYRNDELEQAVKDFGPLGPVAYLMAADEAFLRANDALIRKGNLRIMASVDESGSVQDTERAWAGLLQLDVSLVLTNHPTQLMRFLNRGQASARQ